MWILFILLDVNGGSNVVAQEFNSQLKCEVARNTMYKERERLKPDRVIGPEYSLFTGLLSAYCVEK